MTKSQPAPVQQVMKAIGREIDRWRTGELTERDAAHRIAELVALGRQLIILANTSR